VITTPIYPYFTIDLLDAGYFIVGTGDGQNWDELVEGQTPTPMLEDGIDFDALLDLLPEQVRDAVEGNLANYPFTTSDDSVLGPMTTLWVENPYWGEDYPLTFLDSGFYLPKETP
jgi:hypothetical protein